MFAMCGKKDVRMHTSEQTGHIDATSKGPPPYVQKPAEVPVGLTLLLYFLHSMYLVCCVLTHCASARELVATPANL